MKRILIFVLTFTVVFSVWATPNIVNTKRYRIVSENFQNGCVADGRTVGQLTPLYYLPEASTNPEAYWFINEEQPGLFSIKNAKTGQYITYDGLRTDVSFGSDMTRRYVGMTDALDGNNSLWRFDLQDEGVYALRSDAQTDHIWDVRVDSYVVGTYSNSNRANYNQRFLLYDENGTKVVEKTDDPVVVEGFDVSSWFDSTTDSGSGWIHENATWTDPGFGNYRNGEASVVSPFLERWQETNRGPLPDCALYQTLKNLPSGNYVLSADLIAVRQRSSGWGGQAETVGTGVYLFANDHTVAAGTGNERPERYSVSFSLAEAELLTLGVRIENTNANWVACDNFVLRYLGTQDELLEGEKDKIRAELFGYFTSEDIEAKIAECADDFAALEVLRKSVELLPAIDPLSRFVKNITIDGQGITYIESDDQYMCSIPLSNFEQDYTATIRFLSNEDGTQFFISGNQVSDGDQFTFRGVKAERTYILRATLEDGTTVSRNLIFTSLPIVKIYGSFNNEYSEGNILVFEPGKQAPEQLSMKAKWRGGITNSDGKNKRNYHVKLKDAEGNKLERKFFGLRNDNSWILESCQVDMSRIRNRVLTDLWNDYSTPPYYIDQEPKAMTGTRGNFVELILNDEYRGIYCMTENIDRKQMKLKKYDEETDEIHGQLWKSKDWSYATLMGTRPDGGYQPKDYLSTPNAGSEMWDRYQVKYPDFEDYDYQTDWSTLYDAVDFVCHSTDDEFKEHVAEYFDVPLVIDYYILMETTLATDNHGKNMFFAVYDKQVDKRITFSVWDMDATCGQRWSDDYFHSYLLRPDQDYADFIARSEHGDYNLFKRLRDTDAENFNMRVRLRYRDLRRNYLATESILNRFRTYLDEFKTVGADQRESRKWSGNSDVAGHTLDFDDEMNYIEDWFTRRMEYLDDVRFELSSLPTGGLDTVRVLQSASDVYNMNGQKVATLNTIQSLPAGVYIVNGKKVVKK